MFTRNWSASTLAFELVSVLTPSSEDDAAAGDVVDFLGNQESHTLILLGLTVVASYLNFEVLAATGHLNHCRHSS